MVRTCEKSSKASKTEKQKNSLHEDNEKLPLLINFYEKEIRIQAAEML
jgi:hypothetical protein